MNIYKIQITSQGTTKDIGYSAGTNEHDALKAFGLVAPKQIDNMQVGGKDTWLYSASNAPGCQLIIAKL